MRRFCNAASLRALTSSSVAARNMFVFSEQHPVLKNNELGFEYKSNVWVEEWEAKNPDRLPALKPDARPTDISGLESTIKMFNLSQLEGNLAEFDVEPPVPSSMSTRQPYGAQMAFELSTAKTARNWTSNWFCGNGFVNKYKLRLKGGYRDVKPVVVPIKTKVQLFNASQFVDPSAVERTIISGGSRLAYARGSDFETVLSQHREENNFRTGLYFTQKQLEELDLMARADARGCPFGTMNHMELYNIEAVEDHQNLLLAHQRANPQRHMFFFSGRDVPENMWAELDNMSYSMKLWLSSWDLKSHKLKLIENAPRVKYQNVNANSTPLMLYNVEQLEDPAKGFKKAGLCKN